MQKGSQFLVAQYLFPMGDLRYVSFYGREGDSNQGFLVPDHCVSHWKSRWN